MPIEITGLFLNFQMWKRTDDYGYTELLNNFWRVLCDTLASCKGPDPCNPCSGCYKMFLYVKKGSL